MNFQHLMNIQQRINHNYSKFLGTGGLYLQIIFGEKWFMKFFYFCCEKMLKTVESDRP